MGRRILSASVLATVTLCSSLMLPPAVTAAHAKVGSSLIDFAPYASIHVDVDGPVDESFAQQEQKFSAPLTSTTAWHGFCSQGGRDITVDLTYERPIVQIFR